MVKCDKCSGDGLVNREGVEADKDMHPVLSTSKTLCSKCGGSGVLNPEDTRLAAKAAASQASGND